MAIHIHHFKAHLVPYKGIACRRDAPELRHEQAAQCVIVVRVLWQFVQVQQHLQLIHRHHSVQEPGAVLPLRSRRFPFFVQRRDIAHNGFQHIGQGHHAVDGAILIHDEGNRRLVMAETRYHFQGIDPFRHKRRHGQ